MLLKAQKIFFVIFYDLTIGILAFSNVVLFECYRIKRIDLFFSLFSELIQPLFFLVIAIGAIAEIATHIIKKTDTNIGERKIKFYILCGVFIFFPFYPLYLWTQNKL